MASGFATLFGATSSGQKALPLPLLVAYSFFLAGGVALYHVVMSDAISVVLTVAEMLQCLGVGLLAAQVAVSGSVAGISAYALFFHALGLCCRLSSTLWLNGYLPMDTSGDWFYQSVEICQLTLLLWLLYQVLVTCRTTYTEDSDSFPAVPVVIGAFILAGILHADLNARPIFDTLWMAGLFLGTIAVLPQLWLVMHFTRSIETFMSHHIAAVALGRLLCGFSMWQAREDITCVPWVEGINHAVLAILTAHFVHLFLLADFAYLYFRAVVTQGLGCRLSLDGVASLV